MQLPTIGTGCETACRYVVTPWRKADLWRSSCILLRMFGFVSCLRIQNDAYARQHSLRYRRTSVRKDSLQKLAATPAPGQATLAFARRLVPTSEPASTDQLLQRSESRSDNSTKTSSACMPITSRQCHALVDPADNRTCSVQPVL